MVAESGFWKTKVCQIMQPLDAAREIARCHRSCGFGSPTERHGCTTAPVPQEAP